PQLKLWRLLRGSDHVNHGKPSLLVIAANDVEFADLLGYYHRLCEQIGPLPAPQVLNIDHGRQRFLLFALSPQRSAGACTTPVLAFIDVPGLSAEVGPAFEVTGWAFKDGVGLAAVEILLDGRVVASANYGAPKPDVAGFWKVSTDPGQPRVGFRASMTGVSHGMHWLGLRLHGKDGSIEDWPEQTITVR
ncbi:MAG: glycosyltransferase family 39 protein, partial [Pseudoxanthomonas sp.]